MSATETEKSKMASGRGKLPLLLLIALGAAYVSYLVYWPMPEDLPEPWKARNLLSLLHFIGRVSYYGHMLGLGDGYNISRYLIDTFSKIPPKDYSGLKVEDLMFDGVPVRIYIPEGRKTPGPGVVFYHGGGWIVCSKESHDPMTSILAREVNAVVVSVDYRLAPENPYPIPLEDSLKATKYFFKNAKNWTVDINRIAVMGDSAGGNLAAAVALKLKSEAFRPMPKVQALIYPMLQAFDFTGPSHTENSGTVLGSPTEVAFVSLSYMGADFQLLWQVVNGNHTTLQMRKDYERLIDFSLVPEELKRNYTKKSLPGGSNTLADQLKSRLLDPYCFPLMANNLENLPTTYVATADHDPLRDDGIMYAKRLERAEVKVTWNNYKDGYHGIMALITPPLQTSVGLKMFNDLLDFTKRNL